MNVAELFAVLDADEESVRAVGLGIGLTDASIPHGLQSARAHVASQAHGKFATRALEKVVFVALPGRLVEALLGREWQGESAKYIPRVGVNSYGRDRNVRRLAVQLASAWNSPDASRYLPALKWPCGT